MGYLQLIIFHKFFSRDHIMDLRFSFLLSVALLLNLFIYCSEAGRSRGDDDDENDGRRGGPNRRRSGGPRGDDDDEGDDDRVPLKMLNRGDKEKGPKRGGRNGDSSEEGEWDGARKKMGGGRRMAPRDHKGRPWENEEEEGRRGKDGGGRDKRRMWSMRGRGGPEDDFGSGESRGKGRGMRGHKGKGKGRFGKSDRFSFLKRRPPVQWKPWEESKCLWVDQVKEVPESCHLKNLVEKLPPPVAKYYASKAFETYEMVKKVFKDRGLTEVCGHCSRKVACRQAAFSPNKYFVPIEFAFVNENCDNGDPCQVSAVDGTCPAPLPQKYFVMYNLLSSANRAVSKKGGFHFNGRHFGGVDFPFKLSGGKDGDDDDGNDNDEGDDGNDSGNGGDDGNDFDDDWARDDQWPYNGVDDNSGNETETETSELSPAGNVSTIFVPVVVVEVQKPPRGFKGKFKGKRFRPQEMAPKRYSYDIPLWHCVKNPVADDKCLCCCGDFYPDAALGKCIPVKHGNRYPPMDIDLEP